MSEQQRDQEWRRMQRQAWDPRDWFMRDEAPPLPEGKRPMWVYRCVAGHETPWQVGYYYQGEHSFAKRGWFLDSTYKTREQARQRVHWLNGGTVHAQSFADDSDGDAA